MLLCPAREVVVFAELIVSTPSSSTKANVSGSPTTKGHAQHPGITHAADPLGFTQTLTGKLRSDGFKRPPSAGPKDSWCTATRAGVG